MIKNYIALIFLILGIILLVPNLEITGNVISDSFYNISITNILGLMFIIFSVIIFITKKTLDAIVIPTGPADIKRTEKALEEEEKLTDRGYFLISGYSQKELKPKERQVYNIYKRLRSEGIKPKKIGLERKSHDTRENLIYSLRKIEERAKKSGHKGPIKVGFVSYPGHLKRFEDFYNQAIKEELIEKDKIKFYKIPTKETQEEKNYEGNLARKLFHKYKLRTIKKIS